MVSAMRMATVGVSSLPQALSLFRDIMELQVERLGRVPPPLLKAWGLSLTTSARMAILSCKGYPVGRLRLVEYSPAPQQRVRLDFGSVNPDSGTDIGPKAIDFYVADPIKPSVARIEAAGYRFRSPPVKHQIGDTISEECLFSGPDGVPVLIMVGHRHSPNSLRAGSPDGPFSEIPTISVVAGDLAKSRAFYEGVLGLTAVGDAETPDRYRTLVNDLTGTPHGTRIHFLLYAQKGEPSGKILLVHFFDGTGKRLKGRMKPGHLGFSLLTHDTPSIEELHQALKANGAEIVTAPTLISGDGLPYKVMLAKGPNEEMFEFVQPVGAAARAARFGAGRAKPTPPAKAPTPAKPVAKAGPTPKPKAKPKAKPAKAKLAKKPAAKPAKKAVKARKPAPKKAKAKAKPAKKKKGGKR